MLGSQSTDPYNSQVDKGEKRRERKRDGNIIIGVNYAVRRTEGGPSWCGFVVKHIDVATVGTHWTQSNLHDRWYMHVYKGHKIPCSFLLVTV